MLIAALTFGLLSIPCAATAERQAAPKHAGADSAEKIIAILHNSRVSYEKDLQTTPFKEVLDDLAKKYGIMFIIDKTAIGDMANSLDTTKAEKLSVSNLDGLPLGKFLNIYFRALPVPQITYLVRNDFIEITSWDAAQTETGLPVKKNENPLSAWATLKPALVCVAVQDASLSSAINDLSRSYSINIVVDTAVRPQVEKTRLTERLLNVPADIAVELLARQAGLNVVQRGNTFRITQ
jgi:type II secretory pathway component GspD/PulD (secretin)